MKANFPKIILYVMWSSIVFAIGRTFGYMQCKEKYEDDYKFQSLQIDTLNVKAKELKVTYDSIKNSECFKNQLTK